MKRVTPGMVMALLTGALVAGSAVLAPSAAAVTPTTATVDFDCGSYGSGTASLTAAQDGTSATITVTQPALTSPVDIPAGSVTSTLTLTDGSATTTFTGSSNPDVAAGDPVSTGPLTGTVASGDSLSAGELSVTVFGRTASCTATSAQAPGPFVFD
ncbi:hypothetical protein ACIPSJ_42920 [Streptomyces sp. NPDC090088]|uniref:hypothetical protein n=1 Tax=Streptomyces sp. NPDC090088 TaxID=3365944 RepID=UPI00380B71CF